MSLIHKQEIWMPTLQGWLVILGCFIGFIIFFAKFIYAFLAVNSPVKADFLVFEGWMSDDEIKEAIREFKRGGYQKMIVIGPSLFAGHYLSQYKNFAELGAATLIALGFDAEQLIIIPTPDVLRNRTDATAVALSEWITNSDLNVKSLNIYTFDVHSRRSLQIFKQALAPGIKVGVIVLKPLNYDHHQWWASSAGVKTIVSEVISCIYAYFVAIKL